MHFFDEILATTYHTMESRVDNLNLDHHENREVSRGAMPGPLPSEDRAFLTRVVAILGTVQVLFRLA